MTRHLPLIRSVALCLAVLTLPATPALAQGSGGTRPGAAPVAVPLQSSLTRIDALDLSFFLPQGSVAETTSFGANATMGVELPDQLGVLVIKGQRSSNNDLTVTQVAESMIEQLMLAQGVQDGGTGQFHSAAKLLERTPVSRSTLNGERFYIRMAGANGSPQMIRGVTVFLTEPGRFVVFDLMTEAPKLEQARRVYETVVGTMEVTDRDALAERRPACRT